MQPLTLVASNPTPQPANDSKPVEYSPYDRRTLDAYTAKLHKGRYFRQFDGTSQYPWIISALEADKLPMSWLSADLGAYCREKGRRLPSPFPSPEYLAYGLEVVNGTEFFPKGPSVIRTPGTRHRYANTYKEYIPVHKPIEISPHFHKLFECWFPDPVERHTFLQYIAHIIQHPDVRPSWHLMILSETGTGKGFFYTKILIPLICGQFQKLSKFNELTGRFSNALRGTTVVVLDDAKATRKDQQDQMKSLLSDEQTLLEEKGKAPGMVSTYSRIIFFTNEEVPLNVNHTERRWFIPKRLGYCHGLKDEAGRAHRQETVIAPLAKWLKLGGAIEALYDYFKNYDLTGFNPHLAPMTETLREQIVKSVSQDEIFTAEFLDQHETKVVKVPELLAAFLAASMKKPGNKDVGGLFRACKYRTDFLTVNNSKSRWWFPESMTAKEAEAILSRKATENAINPF